MKWRRSSTCWEKILAAFGWRKKVLLSVSESADKHKEEGFVAVLEIGPAMTRVFIYKEDDHPTCQPS